MTVSDSPDFKALVQFLIAPFLDSPESLKVDCEVLPRTSRVMLRVAFDGEEKGRVFGRGGRNIQAIRTVLQAVATLSGYTAHLDVYGSTSSRDGDEAGAPSRRPIPRRPPQRRDSPSP